MHVWLLFLAWTTAYGINRISESDLIAVNFVQAVEGRKLNGSTINEEEVDSESCCRRKCVKDKRCLSYNFGRTSNKSGRFKCQLSDSDRFVGIANFTRDENFKYVGIQASKRNAEFSAWVFHLVKLHYRWFPVFSSDAGKVSLFV